MEDMYWIKLSLISDKFAGTTLRDARTKFSTGRKVTKTCQQRSTKDDLERFNKTNATNKLLDKSKTTSHLFNY